MPKDFFARLESLAVMPAIILDDVAQATPLGESLVDGGLPIAEVTLRTPTALESLKEMAQIPNLLTGAGTVLNVKQARQAIEAGAKFIVSPGVDTDLITFCLEVGIPIIPGACTPSEVMKAANLGLTCVKFFPCEAMGGLKMLRALTGPFPAMRFMPTGGITLETLPEYLSFKPVMAVGGTWMLKREWLQNERYDIIADACETTVGAVMQVRRAKGLISRPKVS